jgi:hypothetical protein
MTSRPLAAAAIIAFFVSRSVTAGTPDRSDPKAAAFSFASTLLLGDAEGVRACYAGADRKALDAILAFEQSVARLSSVASEKFGDSGKIILHEFGEFRLNKTSLPLLILTSEVKLEGERALLVAPDEQFVIELRRSEGVWKVTKVELDQLIPMASALTRAAIRVTDDATHDRFIRLHELCKAYVDASAEEFARELQPEKPAN